MISKKTADEVLKVLMDHCSQEQIREIVTDLLRVEGNSSFRDTIRYLVSITGTARRG